jgi:4-carboxymuconolactone decarboxylase
VLEGLSMQPRKPRILPLAETEWTAEVREALPAGASSTLNIFTTLARHPKLLKRWLVFASHVLVKSTVPARERELLILRTGVRCRCEYEWGQHVAIARQIGISEDEIRRVTAGPDAAEWSAFDAALLREADELHDTYTISDETWRLLSEHYDARQMMDVVFTVGQYTLVSMALNAFGVPLDPDIEGFAP